MPNNLELIRDAVVAFYGVDYHIGDRFSSAIHMQFTPTLYAVVYPPNMFRRDWFANVYYSGTNGVYASFESMASAFDWIAANARYEARQNEIFSL